MSPESAERDERELPPLKTTVLMYHDVIRGGDPDASGFPGSAAARYKLGWEQFIEHLDLFATTARQPGTVDLLVGGRALAGSWSLTFDDGGASAFDVGEELARRGWQGQFFISTDFIGRRAFLAPEGIRALSGMGHVIGSHSCSHPSRMSSRSSTDLLDEWRRSVELLSELVGQRVSVASVPGGYYSKAVARAAAAAGIEALYTSEPVRAVRSIEECLVIGRYAMVRGVSARTAADVLAGRRLPWLRRQAAWNVRKAAKAAGGGTYPRVRAALLARLGSSR